MVRKILIAFITAICMLIAVVGFSACNMGETTYSVRFVDEDGYTQASPTQSIVAGGKFTIPQEPQKEGKVFVGWVIRGSDDIYDFSVVNSTVVNYDMTFIAKYKNADQEHTITFLGEDGSTIISEQVVNHGQSFYVPNVDETNSEGFAFLGWLRKVTVGWSNDVYDFSTHGVIADSDMTFKAYYPFANVVIQTESGQILKSERIALSGKVTKPYNSDDTLWQSFRVKNSDGSIGDTEFDFEKPITTDTTIIALECRRVLHVIGGVVVKNNSGQNVVDGSYLKKNEVYSVTINDNASANDTLLSVAVEGRLIGGDDLPTFKASIISTNNTVINLRIDGHATNCSALNGTSTYEFIANQSLNLSITKEKLDYNTNPAYATKSANEADQNVLYDNGVYYRPLWTKKTATWVIAYGTDLNNWGGNDAWQYKSVIDLKATFGDRYVQDDWAPDLIKFNGKYYITGTVGLNDYTNSYNKTFYRTIVIFEADSPLGEYRLISKKNTAKDTAIWAKNRNGRVAPKYGTELGGITTAEWDSIDSTIYVENGVPYLLWSDEWTNYSGNGNIGNYYYARLTDDLSMLAETPKLLFTPSSFVSAHRTTDSVWVHKTKAGDLLAIYTSYDSNGNYCVHSARSSNDLITGSWSYVGVLYDKTNPDLALIAPNTGEVAVGGHANIFETVDGQLYLSLHLHQNDSDGVSTGGWRCPSIIALREEGQHGSVRLVWGLNDSKCIVKKVGYTQQVAENFKTARVSFEANSDDNTLVGVKLTYGNGSIIMILADNKGNLYIDNEIAATIAGNGNGGFSLDINVDLSIVELMLNGTNISEAAKTKLDEGIVIKVDLCVVAQDGTNNGNAAFSMISYGSK